MTSTPDEKYQSMPNLKYKCARCGGFAVKHVDLGLLIVDALAFDGRISAIPYTPDHVDLCPQHLMEANVKYVYFTEYDLGRCPEYLAVQPALKMAVHC